MLLQYLGLHLLVLRSLPELLEALLPADALLSEVHFAGVPLGGQAPLRG